MNQIEIIANFDNMHKAYKRVVSRNTGTVAAMKFEKHALEGIDRLQYALLSGEYEMGPYMVFSVHYPKERLVKACCFKDKIVQRSACHEVLWPMMDPHLITDNYASREGMGTKMAVDRFKSNLYNYYQHYGNVGYILKIDVKKYFYSINNDILKEQMRGYGFDQSILSLLDLIIDSMCHEVRNGVRYGVPIGNQTSQNFAVQYLNPVDHFIKDQLGIKYYGRYMDDSYIIGNSKAELNDLKDVIRDKCALLDLELNGKTQVIPIHKGITFLGKRFELSPTGKITTRLTSQNIRHRHAEIHKKAALVALGELSADEFWQSFVAWNGYAKHADTYRIRHEMYAYAKEELHNALKQQLRTELSYKSGIPLRS